MKILGKIIISLSIILSIFSFKEITYWEAVEWLNSVPRWSNKELTNKKDLWVAIDDVWLKIINWVRWVFSWVLVILIVYAWIQMVLSTWTDEDQLSRAKRTIWYSIIWLIFINFPIEIYNSFVNHWWGKDNLFLYREWFVKVLESILTAIEILIWWIAIFILVYEWIILILNWKDEEALKRAKNKILWVVIALIFLWFIQVWIIFLREGNINTSTSIFKSIADLALYFAWPIALFFLSLAWYYYIFSNWNEEKMNKWKNIVINTCIGVIILICVYVLLNDLSLLSF